MMSLLKIVFITFCSILAGAAMFCGVVAWPFATVDSSVLSYFLFTAAVGLLVFSVPTAIAIGVGWKIYAVGSSWRARLLLYCCLAILGTAFVRLTLYEYSADRFSTAYCMGGCAGGLTGAFLITMWKRYDT